MTAPPDGFHPCPGPLCKLAVDYDKLACIGHWKQVPAPLQRAVYSAYRAAPHGPAHVAAMTAAIGAMRPFKSDLAGRP